MSDCINCARLETERDAIRAEQESDARQIIHHGLTIGDLRAEIARLQELLDQATRVRPLFDAASSPEIGLREMPYVEAAMATDHGMATRREMFSLGWRAGRDYGQTISETGNTRAAGRDLNQAAATLRRIAHRVERCARQFGA